MHTITFYPKAKPTLDEVKGFVRSFPEGDWVTDAGTPRGVIESDDGRVYLDYDDRYRDSFDRGLDARQQAELTSRLGFSPTQALHLHASHAFAQSRQLALEVCASLATRWGGGWSE